MLQYIILKIVNMSSCSNVFHFASNLAMWNHSAGKILRFAQDDKVSFVILSKAKDLKISHILPHISMLCPSRVLVTGASFFAIPTSYAP